ncbi:MAG: cation:proton antiporter [Candidatus Nanopelagicales bacterium]|nr:cation:proton antiporter [Candidatus Nanopelagicales bacterium]
MDPNDLVATLTDPIWILIAFAAGFLCRAIGLPPLVGYLAAGLGLHAFGAETGALLDQIADVGIILLLFTVGLKLNLKSLFKAEIWVVGTLEVTLATFGFTGVIWLLAFTQTGPFSGLDLRAALLLGISLSFSSTVFAVKVLEDRGAASSRHGKLAIGVLVLQDFIAVIILAASAQAWPSVWALALVLLIPARPLLVRVMNSSGHGELLLLFGVAAALSGSALFDAVGIKGAVGALAAGLLLSNTEKADELSKNMLGLKDIFLVGFFLSVGMTQFPDGIGIAIAAALILILPLKALLYFLLFSMRFLRARTSWQASLDLANYSEFGLILLVVAAGVGWIPSIWIAVLALAIIGSFAISAPIAERGDVFYRHVRASLKRHERARRLPGDEDLHVLDIDYVVFGMGRIGSHAYSALNAQHPGRVLGVDMDSARIARAQAHQQTCVVGDATDPEFWSRTDGLVEHLSWVLLTMSSHEANVAAVELLRERGFVGKIAATSTFPDDAQDLRNLGVDLAFDVYAEAGAGFAAHLSQRIAEE